MSAVSQWAFLLAQYAFSCLHRTYRSRSRNPRKTKIVRVCVDRLRYTQVHGGHLVSGRNAEKRFLCDCLFSPVRYIAGTRVEA